MTAIWLGILLGYLIGGIPTGVLVARIVAGADPRAVGSRHTGGTNVARAVGRAWPGVITAVVDLGLGVGAVCAARGVWPDDPMAAAAAGGAAVIGHNWSPYIRFAGGVGLSTLAGMLGAQAPLHTLLLLVPSIVAWILLRKVVPHDARRTVLVILFAPVLMLVFGLPVQVCVSAAAGVLVATIRSALDWRRTYVAGEGALGQFFGRGTPG